MSEYYLVDVKSITSKVLRSEFKVDELEALAKSILEANGLLSPLLLKQTGVDSYEVLAGDREYYAAVRAKEINPRAAEMVNAFIIPEDLEDAAIKQFASLHATRSTVIPDPPSTSEPKPPASSSIADQRLTNLESRLDEALRDIKQTQQREVQRLEQQITTLQQKIPQKVEPLEIFNTANTAELLQKMAIAGIRGKRAEKLIENIEKARKQSSFTSFTDVVSRIGGLGDKRMLTILDAWGGMY
jgi:ParB-like nuclease domain